MPTTDSSNRATIQLLSEANYKATYSKIKQIHGRRILQEWTERTDPQKFVSEDCGIAAYLLELWRCYPEIGPRTGFADLGCGNGLLVHLLSREGISGGLGLDVRRRRIWDKFEAEGSVLKEATVNPDFFDAFSGQLENVDFLIGNHCDELTPWIPVMAARLRCNFFLLPCCPHNFFSKFAKITPSARDKGLIGGVADQFNAYLEKICARLGFTLMKDRLRIPSRKNVCFIGVVPKSGLAENLDEVIDELLSAAKIHKKSFTPRPPKEMVRNCSRLPHDAKIGLARRIVDYLIGKGPEEKINEWHCGVSVSLPQLSRDVLTAADRKMLSNQDKGLQTFLRNHHQSFCVERAQVSIRKWALVNAEFAAKAAENNKIRQTDCWFFKWHPDGCPLASDVCSFKH